MMDPTIKKYSLIVSSLHPKKFGSNNKAISGMYVDNSCTACCCESVGYHYSKYRQRSYSFVAEWGVGHIDLV